MKKGISFYKRMFAGIALTIVTVLFCSAQDDRPAVMMGVDLPNFYLDILNYPVDSPNVSRLDIYLQVPYEMLSFVKSDFEFTASYEITLSVFDEEGLPVTEKLWSEEIKTNKYQESISPTLGRISQRSVLLPYGSYTINVQMRDEETKKIRQMKRPVKVRNFQDSTFAFSDVMLIKQKEKQGDKSVVVPNISGTVNSAEEQTTVYMELHSAIVPRQLSFVSIIKNKLGFAVRKDTLLETIKKERQACFMNITTKALPVGEYDIEITAYPSGGSGSSAFTQIIKKIRTKAEGLPFTITDLDVAIEQLYYITTQEQLDSMRKAPQEKKREMFMEFWKRRDPTKETGTNELMLEYYQRVEFSNKNYTHFVEGWKSDRGNIYIVFGEPNNIERHPFEIDTKPYEVWTYYQLNREFVFVDESGFGDYRLRNPMWDVWKPRPR